MGRAAAGPWIPAASTGEESGEHKEQTGERGLGRKAGGDQGQGRRDADQVCSGTGGNAGGVGTHCTQKAAESQDQGGAATAQG
jgi:hypothetical protein